ncbi:DUF3899 domain-containing protein [Bacillus sp. V5-8f]|uniref:DUF3899 domain-containing protein n=1 Tax=Bacillus sp. V5-8f TaxID=2053044 RepID=UPI0015E0E94C|nr:DUF3899 domain-containing protein [Bacillus sp. V5-8f]
MKKTFFWTATSIFLVLLLSVLLYRELSLLHFINLTFYIAGGLLSVSLLAMVTQKGFFDAIFLSFRTVLDRTDNKEEKKPLSKLISFDYSTLFSVGISLLVIMLAALSLYYL